MLKGKQLKALEKLVSGDYESYDKLADELKISHKTLYNWRHEEEFVAELERRINIKIGGIAPRALRRVEKIIDSKNEEVALRACRDVLDRAGYKATEKVSVDGELNTGVVLMPPIMTDLIPPNDEDNE